MTFNGMFSVTVPKCFVFILLGVVVQAEVAKRPHIVFIMADDMGWNDVGFHGSELSTPNIDALGYHGVILNRHYSPAVCTPSRAATLTGRYPIRYGLYDPIPAGHTIGLPLNEKILPQYLQELGYKTHLVGKWHLGSHTTEFTPTKRGFHEHFGFWNGYIGFYDAVHATDNNGPKGLEFHRNLKPAWQEAYGKYITSVLSDEATRVIKGHNTSEPLFMLVAHAAPHTGNPSQLMQSPPSSNGGPRFIKDPVRRIYADMVKLLDNSVGEIVNELKEKNMLNNSIIIFTSDNGAPTNDLRWRYSNHGSNWPLRGQKLSAHEGGVRTNAVIWSNQIQNPGRVVDNLFHVVDWTPTLVAAAGGNDVEFNHLDGINLWPLITINGSVTRNEMLPEMNDGTEAVVVGKWKLIKDYPKDDKSSFADLYYGENTRNVVMYNTSEVANSPTAKALSEFNPMTTAKYSELRTKSMVDSKCRARIVQANITVVDKCYEKHCLFDIYSDPCELNNVADQNPDTVEELKSKLNIFRNDKVPKISLPFDPDADPKNWNDRWVPWKDSGTSRTQNFGLLISLLLLILSFTSR